MLHLLTWPRLSSLEPTLVLPPDPLRLGQEAAHVFPHGGVQHIGADLLVPTGTLAAEAIGVRARAAVVGVGDLAPGRGPARRLAVAAVAAPFAHDQALGQVLAATRSVTPALPVLFELSLDHPEEVRAHQPGDVDENLSLRWCVDP